MVSVSTIFSHVSPLGLLVLGLLVLFSVTSWAVIIAKWFALSSSTTATEAFIERFWHTRELQLLLEDPSFAKGSPCVRILRDGINEFQRTKGFVVLERAVSRAGRAEMSKLEQAIPLLATIGAISPFVGLFGTVVGIMTSFQEIGVTGSASLHTVAPGIAEALAATALGLFAAIPAVMAYNFFTVRLRRLKSDVEHFSLDLLAVLKAQNS